MRVIEPFRVTRERSNRLMRTLRRDARLATDPSHGIAVGLVSSDLAMPPTCGDHSLTPG